jgi:hypothetical protein
VKIVTLGRGSDGSVGRKSQYTRTWPGLNEQNRLSDRGNGSHTAISHTSRFGSGWRLDSALSPVKIFDKKRMGDVDMGVDET